MRAHTPIVRGGRDLGDSSLDTTAGISLSQAVSVGLASMNRGSAPPYASPRTFSYTLSASIQNSVLSRVPQSRRRRIM